jgi:hypothetical protein
MRMPARIDDTWQSLTGPGIHRECCWRSFVAVAESKLRERLKHLRFDFLRSSDVLCGIRNRRKDLSEPLGSVVIVVEQVDESELRVLQPLQYRVSRAWRHRSRCHVSNAQPRMVASLRLCVYTASQIQKID